MTSPVPVTEASLLRQLQALRLRTVPVALQRILLQATAPLLLRRLTAAGWLAYQTVRHHHRAGRLLTAAGLTRDRCLLSVCHALQSISRHQRVMSPAKPRAITGVRHGVTGPNSCICFVPTRSGHAAESPWQLTCFARRRALLLELAQAQDASPFVYWADGSSPLSCRALGIRVC